MEAFQNLVGVDLTTNEKRYLHANEPIILQLASEYKLPKIHADEALTRLRSRVKSTTIKCIGVTDIKIKKVIRASQGKCSIYSATVRMTAAVGKFFTKDSIWDFQRELENFLKIPAHPSVVKLIFYADLPDDRAHCGVIFFPFYNQCLSDLICDVPIVVNRLENLWSLAKGIIIGLNHLHSSGYIHCDIKPGNIVLDDNGNVILIDLGSAVPNGTIVIEHTSSYSMGLHNDLANPRLDWVCTAVTLHVCIQGYCLVRSIDDLCMFGKNLDNTVGDLIMRLCGEFALTIILDET